LTKSSREIMEILEAYDLTGCAWSAAELAGCDAKTITRYVSVRDRGGDPYAVARRARLIDPFLDKVEELVDRSEGKVRADKVHEPSLPAGQDAAEAFYRVVDAAYERRSVAVTSNIKPSGFDTIMPKTLATTTVDRLLHHAHQVLTDGRSQRLAEALAGKGVVPLT